jgi:hypothetical protein
MKALIVIVVVALLALGGYRGYEYWQTMKEQEQPRSRRTTAEAPSQPLANQLPGMPPTLEPSLEAARKQGATGLRNWLITYGKLVRDPRLASIELDYVVLVARENPIEAKTAYARVKQRVQPDSPVFARVKQLEKTYE